MQEILPYIFTHIDDSICATGSLGQVLYMNTAAETLFRCEQHWQDRKLWEVIPFVERNDALIQLFIDAHAQREKTIQALTDYENSAGELFHLRVSITCGSGDSPVFIAVISDLTRLIQVNSALVRYTSPEIADFVLNTPEGSSQGGWRQEVSVLMSDLRGFTAISARLPSGDLVRMLNDYFAVMAEIIARYRGTIIEFLGDGIFVVFGAPSSLSDHADAAVACALEMENAMERVNLRNRENGFPLLEMGIGINSGDVTVGNIGSEQKMKFGCVGETVNLAGRTESLTTGGQVLITEHTLAMLHEAPEILQVRSFLPKGENIPLKVYEIAGLSSLRLHSLPDREPVWQDLAHPVPFDFRLLQGKAAEASVYHGTLLRLSEDGREGWIRSDTALSEMQNLVMETGELTWAKVISVSPDSARIRFTFRPEGFPAWVTEHMDAQSGSAG